MVYTGAYGRTRHVTKRQVSEPPDADADADVDSNADADADADVDAPDLLERRDERKRETRGDARRDEM